MRQRIARALLTPAMLVALIALAIAVGGTAWAAATIRSADVVNESLTGADVKNASLTGADVKNATLGIADLSAAARTSLTGQAGPRGDTGATGANGTNGAAGAQGATGAAGSARAVATVWGDATPSCTVIAATSRNVTSCSWNGPGEYFIQFAAGVDFTGTYPVCSLGHSDGTNLTSMMYCVVAPAVQPNAVNVKVYRADETTIVTPISLVDTTATVPVIVVIP
jgi:hypothetical protein